MTDLQPNTNASTTGATGGSSSGGGDMLDKAVAFLERKAGHEQVIITFAGWTLWQD